MQPNNQKSNKAYTIGFKPFFGSSSGKKVRLFSAIISTAPVAVLSELYSFECIWTYFLLNLTLVLAIANPAACTVHQQPIGLAAVVGSVAANYGQRH